MSEISLRFRLTTEDLMSYAKSASGGRSRTLNYIFCVAAVFFIVRNILSEDSSYVITALLLIFVLTVLFRPYFEMRMVRKHQKDHYALKTDISLEFFDDHIVEKSMGGETGIEFENHFPLEAIMNILETNEHFAFFVSPIEAIIAPKRAMSEEDREKLKNLIENLFINKYQRRS